MRIIDLLNKIANGEEVPKKVEYENVTYEFIEENRHYLAYINRKEIDNSRYLMYMVDNLNDTVEILEEENKIEKIDKLDLDYKSNIYSDEYTFRKEIMFYCDNLQSKINNLIDEINKLKEDKNG